MQFHRERADETLLNAAVALADGWRSVPPDTRLDVRALIREFGPRIAQADRQNCTAEIGTMLRALWGLQERLPAGVGVALRAGVGPSAPGLTVVPEAQRKRILAALIDICDARPYHRPVALARGIGALISANAGHLLEDEHRAWRELEGDYARHGDPIRYLDGVEALFSGVNTIRDALAAGRTWISTRGAGAVAASRDSAVPVRGEDMTAGSLMRIATAHFPPTLLLAQKGIPLIVHVARPQGDEGQHARLQVQPGDLTVQLDAEDFEVSSAIGGRGVPGAPMARVVHVSEESDCEPVVFFLDPQQPGAKRVSVALYQQSLCLAVIRIGTRVLTAAGGAAPASTQASQAQVALHGDAHPSPPDLELRIMLLADGKTLTFMLHSHNGDYNFRPVGRVTLLGEPQAFLDGMLGDLSRLARFEAKDRSEAMTREALRRINTIGMRLYDELWPDELKREYADVIRGRYAGKTMLITSDEPWIPWEMIRPFSIQGGRLGFNDPPLCENFKLTRWLAGRGAPDELTVRRGVIVAPPVNLPAVRSELDYFAQLRRRRWELDLRGPITRVADVLAEVESGEAHWLHLSTHGNFDAADPLTSVLRLEDGYLRPGQLIGQAQAGIERAAPLVFVNACHAGQNGLTLTRIGGWAEMFLSAGAGAFVGSLWEINDRLAAAFSAAFYDALLGLKGNARPIADAFHEARLTIKALDPANPTWLAYVLYAAPHTRVTLAPPIA